VAEEDFLYIESRRLEQSYNKIAAERADLLKILGGREGIGAHGGVQVGVGGGVKGAAVKDAGQERKKKGQTGWEFEGLNGGGLPEGWAGEGSKRKATAEQGKCKVIESICRMLTIFLTMIDAANCIERHPVPSVSAPKANIFPSVGVRSARTASVKPGVQAKVSAALVELGISTRLIMPTKGNMEKLDSLQTSLAQLVELKKAVDRIQGEMRMTSKKKDALLGIEDVAEVKKEDGDDSRADRETSIRVSGPSRKAWCPQCLTPGSRRNAVLQRVQHRRTNGPDEIRQSTPVALQLAPLLQLGFFRICIYCVTPCLY
jgi:DNA methyltransferase 1-associated protein 1